MRAEASEARCAHKTCSACTWRPRRPGLDLRFRVHPHRRSTSRAFWMQMFIHWTRTYGKQLDAIIGAGERAVKRTTVPRGARTEVGRGRRRAEHRGPGLDGCCQDVLCHRAWGGSGPGHPLARGQDRIDSAKWALCVTGCPKSFVFNGNTTITHNNNDSS